jgi:hypothetical protein
MTFYSSFSDQTKIPSGFRNAYAVSFQTLSISKDGMFYQCDYYQPHIFLYLMHHNSPCNFHKPLALYNDSHYHGIILCHGMSYEFKTKFKTQNKLLEVKTKINSNVLYLRTHMDQLNFYKELVDVCGEPIFNCFSSDKKVKVVLQTTRDLLPLNFNQSFFQWTVNGEKIIYKYIGNSNNINDNEENSQCSYTSGYTNVTNHSGVTFQSEISDFSLKHRIQPYTTRPVQTDKKDRECQELKKLFVREYTRRGAEVFFKSFGLAMETMCRTEKTHEKKNNYKTKTCLLPNLNSPTTVTTCSQSVTSFNLIGGIDLFNKTDQTRQFKVLNDNKEKKSSEGNSCDINNISPPETSLSETLTTVRNAVLVDSFENTSVLQYNNSERSVVDHYSDNSAGTLDYSFLEEFAEPSS